VGYDGERVHFRLYDASQVTTYKFLTVKYDLGDTDEGLSFTKGNYSSPQFVVSIILAEKYRVIIEQRLISTLHTVP
jgi:hypothetical protein